MTEVSNLVKKGRSKPRSNLSSFDTSQIEAELQAIESEVLGLDAASVKKAKQGDVVEQTTVAAEEATQVFKSRPTNALEFNPEGSELLHRLSRNGLDDQTSSKPQKTAPVQIPTKPVSYQLKKDTGRNIDGMIASKSKQLYPKAVPPSPANQPDAKPVNITSVALKGLKHANEFNSYAFRQHKSSLHNQVESRSLFEKSLDGDVQIVDHGDRVNNGAKRYTKVKRRSKMLGGVDQHNLDTGKAKRALGYRPFKLLIPVMALFFIGSYVMYLNMPSIHLKLAENKAGISINQPSYKPDGFKLAGIADAETGKVAMSFKNGDTTYNVSQSVSDWDSKALLENKVLRETKEYNSYTDRGLTIYTYNGKAVWVNQGKVNEIDSVNSKLEPEEMVRIAGSM